MVSSSSNSSSSGAAIIETVECFHCGVQTQLFALIYDAADIWNIYLCQNCLEEAKKNDGKLCVYCREAAEQLLQQGLQSSAGQEVSEQLYSN
jgi:hypothetical protein